MSDNETRGEFVGELESILRSAFLDDQDQYELSPDDIDDLETQLTDACAEARKRLARGRKP